MPGTSTTALTAEVTNISAHGFWLLATASVNAPDANLDEPVELYLSFEDFPWFRSAPVSSIINVERTPNTDHLYWPDLDADLDFDVIQHPENYALIFQR